jgi:carbon monoxide dehydrogenase subunit G
MILTISATMIIVWHIPQAAAISLEEIKVSHEIPAPLDQVWNIVSDIDNDTKYWSTFKAIKNINETGNVIEREVTLLAGPQGDTKTHQFVTVNPEQFVVDTNITEGPVVGNRVLTLSPYSESNTTTKIDATWKIDLSSIPLIGRGYAKDGIMKTTEEAFDKIAQAVE